VYVSVSVCVCLWVCVCVSVFLCLFEEFNHPESLRKKIAFHSQ